MQINFFEKYKKIINVLVLGLSLMITLSFVRSINKMLRIKKQVEEKQVKLSQLKNANEEIKNRLKEIESNVFLEKQLRDNLGLVKEGEIIVVLPDKNILRELSPDINEDMEVLPQPIWKKWLKLFL